MRSVILLRYSLALILVGLGSAALVVAASARSRGDSTRGQDRLVDSYCRRGRRVAMSTFTWPDIRTAD